MLAGTGVDATVVVHFDAERAGESAEDFVNEVLVRMLATRAVVVGEDFTGGGLAGHGVFLLVGSLQPVGGLTGWRPAMPVTQWALTKP